MGTFNKFHYPFLRQIEKVHLAQAIEAQMSQHSVIRRWIVERVTDLNQSCDCQHCCLVLFILCEGLKRSRSKRLILKRATFWGFEEDCCMQGSLTSCDRSVVLVGVLVFSFLSITASSLDSPATHTILRRPRKILFYYDALYKDRTMTVFSRFQCFFAITQLPMLCLKFIDFCTVIFSPVMWGFRCTPNLWAGVVGRDLRSRFSKRMYFPGGFTHGLTLCHSCCETTWNSRCWVWKPIVERYIPT